MVNKYFNIFFLPANTKFGQDKKKNIFKEEAENVVMLTHNGRQLTKSDNI